MGRGEEGASRFIVWSHTLYSGNYTIWRPNSPYLTLRACSRDPVTKVTLFSAARARPSDVFLSLWATHPDVSGQI